MTDQLTDRAPTVGAAPLDDLIGVEPISVEILELGPAEGEDLVYALTAPQEIGGAGSGVFAPHARIRNNSSFDIRLVRVGVLPFAESGGLLLPSGPPVVYDSADITLDAADTVFQSDDADGVIIAAGAIRSFHIQKRSGNNTINVVFDEGAAVRFQLTFRFVADTMFEEVVLSRNARPHVNDNGTTTGSYLYPYKAADLRYGEYWSGVSGTTNSHHQKTERHAYDTGARGFDPGAGKFVGHMPGTNETHNLDFRVFGRPLYAVADGVIEEIFDKAADNLPGCAPDGDGTRNLVRLRCGNEIIRYLHIMRGSVDPSLSEGDTVRAGQFLARSGNSGTRAPHLHLDVVRAGDIHRPFHFHEMHILPFGEVSTDDRTGPWITVDGRALASKIGISEGFAIWPSRERPRRLDRAQDSASGADDVVALTAVALGPNTVVTATRLTGSDRLRVFSYAFVGNDIVETGNSGNQAGVVGEVALAAMDQSRVATAVQTATGQLKVITWAIEADGGLERLIDSGDLAGNGDLVSVASLGAGRLVTLVRTAEGVGKLIAWAANGGSSIERLGSKELLIGRVDGLSLAKVGRGQVATFARLSPTEKADLRLWLLSPDGQSFTEIAASVGSGQKISSGAVLGLGADAIVTARRDDNCNRLRVEYWDIEGDELVLRGDGATQGPKLDRSVFLSMADTGSGLFATGARDSDNRAVVQFWCAETGGNSITLLGDSGTQIANGDLVTVVAPTTDRLVAAVRTSSGRQKLIAFEIKG